MVTEIQNGRQEHTADFCSPELLLWSFCHFFGRRLPGLPGKSEGKKKNKTKTHESNSSLPVGAMTENKNLNTESHSSLQFQDPAGIQLRMTLDT